jgi:hypothetical protein
MSIESSHCLVAWLLLGSCALLSPSQVAAQSSRPHLVPSPSVLFAKGVDNRATAPDSTQRTHWKTGAVVGGVIVGTVGAIAMHGLCQDTREYGESDLCLGSTIGGALLGALLGGITGALIGGQFPKD